MKQFIGTGVALVTPFDKDGKIDYLGLEKLLTHVSSRVDYLVVNGTTAESATTTDAEKLSILKFILDYNKGKLPIMYGMGGNNTSKIIEEIKNFNFDGIGSILSVSPYYNKPSQEGIIRHYTALADAAPVPVFLYNVPGRTGTNMLASTTIKLSKHKNIVGIKEANTDVNQNIEILHGVPDDFLVLTGDDMWATALIAMGGKGAISVLANGFPAEFSDLVNLALDNQFKQSTSILKSLIQINPLMYEEGNPVGIKTVLQELGICSNYTRLPIAPASANLVDKIKSAMQRLNKPAVV